LERGRSRGGSLLFHLAVEGVIDIVYLISRARLSAVVLVVVLSGTGLACASKGTLESAPVVLYPSPPDTARIQFLTAISSSRDLAGGRSFWEHLVGTQAHAAKGITKPYGIALRQGKIYVCDTFINGLDIIDLETGSFEFFQPAGRGRLLKPINCFVDGDGMLYVVDTQRAEVVVFTEGGDYAWSMGGSDDATPGDVFVTEDRIWITDLASGTVRVFDKDSRQHLFSFPDAEPNTPEAMGAPANLYVTDDAVYVSDMFLGKVNVYGKDGTYRRTVGSYGTSVGQFARPKGIAVDDDDNLYVVDAAFQNVQVFNGEGQLLMYFGGAGDGPGKMALPAKVIIDYDNVSYFQSNARPDLTVRYLILVTNQYGPNKIGIYGFVGPEPVPAVEGQR